MTRARLYLLYAVLLVIQMVLANFLDVTSYLVISFLPAIIVCLPTRFHTVPVMVAAFALGFVVDFFSGSLLGLSSLALVPVALTRRLFLSLVFGKDYFERREDIVSDRQGMYRTGLCILLETILFLIIYVTVDAAGMTSAGYNTLRIIASTAVGMVAAQFVMRIFASVESEAKWK